MADLPDFWSNRYVNIIAQIIAELTIRPKYGTRGVLEFANFVTASDTTSLGSVEGKGIIYGGAVAVQGVAACGGDSVGSALDGGLEYFCPTMLECITFGLTAQHGGTWQLETYDDTLFRYAGSLSIGITFESKLEILYKETAGRTPYVLSKIMYAVL